MRRVERLAAPRILNSYEVVDGKRRIRTFLDIDAVRRARLRPPIVPRIFLGDEVREALRRTFREKCAFCESELSKTDALVHHFRPIENASDLAGFETRENYVWLAYEWENLFQACHPCDRAKGSFFPVAGSRAGPDLEQSSVKLAEKAELVDPSYDDPNDHLMFLANGACIPRTRTGAVTISVLSLNRPQLVAERRKDMADLVVRLRREALEPGRQDLKRIFSPDRQFVGARLSLLHRFLEEWLGGEFPKEAISPEELFGACTLDAAAEEREAMANAISGMAAKDRLGGEPVEEEPASLHLVDAGRPLGLPRADRKASPPAREIASIRIANFKSLDHLSFELPLRRERDAGPPCLMILGENAAGKSTVLEAVAGALGGTRALNALRVSPSDIVRRDDPDMWNILDPVDAVVEVTFHDDEDAASLVVDAARRRFDGSADAGVLLLAYGARRRFSPSGRGEAVNAADRIAPLFRPETTLASAEDWLRNLSADARTFDAVARALRIVLALEEDDEIAIDPSGRMCVLSVNRLVPIEKLSEGYRSLLCLTADIMRNLLAYWPDLERARAVVLIDELETHLHPRWKMRIMSALREALPGVQFLATTHDPLCLRGMDDGEVVVLERRPDGGVRQLTGLPSVRGMTAEQLLTSEYFGLWSTVDPELEYDMARSTHPESLAPDVTLVSRLVLGDTMREQIIHEALDRYLRSRRDRTADLGAREFAVAQVLRVLGSDDPDYRGGFE